MMLRIIAEERPEVDGRGRPGGEISDGWCYRAVVNAWFPQALAALSAIALVAALSILILSVWSYLAMFRRRAKTHVRVRERLAARGLLDEEFLGRDWLSETIPSPHGYGISVHALEGAEPRIAVFSHGISWNWMSCLQFAKPFHEAGWTVVAHDGRGHGSTGRGRYPSLGVYEKDDLRAVTDWALSRFDGSGGLVLHGTSLGAAVSLQCAGMDPRPAAVISDCAFSSAEAILDWRLARYLREGPARRAVKALVSLMSAAFDGFPLEAADCDRAANASEADILFLHGLSDDVVPPAMSEEMARSRREALPGVRTELVVFKGCGHVKCRMADPGLYDRLVTGFAQSAVERRKAVS